MKREPITKQQVKALTRSLTPMAALLAGLNEVDYTRGRIALTDTKHRMWTTDGHAIEVSVLARDSVIVTKSKEPDPNLPEPL